MELVNPVLDNWGWKALWSFWTTLKIWAQMKILELIHQLVLKLVELKSKEESKIGAPGAYFTKFKRGFNKPVEWDWRSLCWTCKIEWFLDYSGQSKWLSFSRGYFWSRSTNRFWNNFCRYADLYDGTGDPCAGQLRLKALWILATQWEEIVTSENFGLDPPMGSGNNR